MIYDRQLAKISSRCRKCLDELRLQLRQRRQQASARERRDVMSKKMVYVMKRINGKEDHYISNRIKEGKKQAKRNLKERKEWK